MAGPGDIKLNFAAAAGLNNAFSKVGTGKSESSSNNTGYAKTMLAGLLGGDDNSTAYGFTGGNTLANG